MKLHLITLLTIASMFAIDAQAGYCNPERSKPCGGACIALDKTCRKSWTTMKVGVNPDAGAGKGYDKPTFVSERPKGQ